jgi:tetratricopeptide (TPR) repeat protein
VLTFLLKDRYSRPPYTNWSDYDVWLARKKQQAAKYQRSTPEAVRQMITTYRRAIDDQEDVPWLHYNFAHLLFTLGNYREAAVQMRLYLQILPQNYTAHWVLGDALFRQGKLDEAITQCREALRLRPEFHQAAYTLADSLIRQGKMDEGLKVYRKLLKDAPDQSVKIYNQIGMVLTQQEKFAEAVAAFREAIRLNEAANGKSIPDSYYNLGIALKRTGLQDEAVPFLSKAIEDYRKELNGNTQVDPATLKAIGYASVEIGDLDQAAVYFRQAVAFEPWELSTQVNLIKVLELQGKNSEAINACRKAMEYMSRIGRKEAVINLQQYLDRLIERDAVNQNNL